MTPAEPARAAARIQAHIEKFAHVAMAQGAEVVELRALHVSNGNGRPHTVSGYYSDPVAMARDAASLNGAAAGIYVTLDRIDPRLLSRSDNRLTPYPKATTSDEQVERRLWLKVDLDPVRPSGISASDAEKAAAEALARRVRDDLAGAGWPTPILSDSGNGWHLLYRIDLPNDDPSKLLVEGVLRALAARYDSPTVKVDTTTGNAARIWKLPGTLTRKGDHTPDRPHRYARAVALPEHLEVVDVGLLEALADEVAQTAPERRVGARRQADFDLARWVKARRGAIEAKCGRITERQTAGWTTLYVLEKCWRNPSEHNRAEVHFGQLTDGRLGASCKHASCAGHGWSSFREAIEPGHRERRELKDADAPTSDTPRVELVKGREVDAVGEVLGHMRLAPDLYDFGDEVVTVVDGRVHPLNDHGVRHYVGSRVQCWREHPLPKGGTSAVLQDPPQTLCRAILALGPARGLKRLQAVVTAPTLRPDGSVLAAAGYDAETGFLMVPRGEPVEIPSEPTLTDAKEALAALWHPFRLFPFCSPLDKAVHLAALLSAVVRPAVAACPAPGYDAPIQASGKTLLARCVGALAIGEEPPIWPATSGDDEEVRKRIFAALRTGARAILWDNLVGTFDSAALAACLTSATFTDRVLGRSEAPTLPNCALLILTGNNLSLAGDLPRRVLVSRIDPRMPDPHKREFDLDPLEYVIQHRQELVAAALTLVLAHRQAGSPRAPGRMASFERWDDLVRQPVAWIGREVAPGEFGDPMDAVTLAQDADPEQEALGRLLLAWKDVFKDKAVLVRELLDLYHDAARAARGVPTVVVSDRERELAEALSEYKPPRGELTAKTLGRVLMYRKERLVGGLRLEAVGKDRKASTYWRVAGCEGYAGFPYTHACAEVKDLTYKVARGKPGKASLPGTDSFEVPV